MRYYLILILALAFSCRSGEEQSHSHEEARPSLDYTLWTERTELFVEFPALTVGRTSRFAAHFTALDGHKPIVEGSVTVSLIKGDKGIRQKADVPSSPGIFTPSLQPKEAGLHQLVFDLETPTYSDRIVLDGIRVFSTPEEAASNVKEEENGNAITFLKEQAWKIEFQTVPVIEKEIYRTISTSGVWKVAPSDYQTLVAPINGRVNFGPATLTEGSPVKKGQVLMTISGSGLTSNNVEANVQKARADFEQAQSEYERKKQLYDSKIVPKSEFEKVEQKYRIARANYDAMNTGYGVSGKTVTAPFDGFVKYIQTNNGGFVTEGTALLAITSHKSSLLQLQVSPSYGPELQDLQDVWYQPGPGMWSSLKEKGGKILSVGKEVEANQPLLSVFAEVNEGVQMPEGSFTEARLAVGNGTKGAVIPVSALLEDYGKYTVIVQSSGESFERRNVIIGQQNGSEVAIEEGLKPGEMVVAKGAYQVKMASMSGQAPAHGHAH